MTEVNAEIITPFGPSIFKVKIPKQIIDDLNQYVDNTVADETKANKLNHGNQLIGDVTQEFKLEEEFMKQVGWLGFLGNCTSNWIQNVTGKKIKNFALIDSWIVRQFENEYNPIHYHTGHISGSGFLKLPSTFGTHVQRKQKEEKMFGLATGHSASKKGTTGSKRRHCGPCHSQDLCEGPCISLGPRGNFCLSSAALLHMFQNITRAH